MGIKGASATSWVLLFVPIPAAFLSAILFNFIRKGKSPHSGAYYLTMVGLMTSLVVWLTNIGLFYWAQYIDDKNKGHTVKQFFQYAGAALAPAIACLIPFLIYAAYKGTIHTVFKTLDPSQLLDLVHKNPTKAAKIAKANTAAKISERASMLGEGKAATRVATAAIGEETAAAIGAETAATLGVDVGAMLAEDAAAGPIGLAIAAAQAADSITERFPMLTLFQPASIATVAVLIVGWVTNWGITTTVGKSLPDKTT